MVSGRAESVGAIADVEVRVESKESSRVVAADVVGAVAGLAGSEATGRLVCVVT